MNMKSETEASVGTAILSRVAPTTEALSQTIAPCQWPTLAITDRAMRDLDAALAADPLFHRCPDGHQGRVEVRYWYSHPLYFSCWHCSHSSAIRVAEPETVFCRHRMAHESGHPVLEG